MNAPAQAPAAPTATVPPSRPTPGATRTADATNAAAAAIARAEAIAAARPATAAAKPPAAEAATTAPSATPAPIAAPASVPTTELHPWRAFFTDWPSQIPRRGILITKLNEASPFKAFMLRGDFLLLERTSPDSLGGRYLVVPFDEISVVKFTDPLTQPAFEAAGFQGKLSN